MLDDLIMQDETLLKLWWSVEHGGILVVIHVVRIKFVVLVLVAVAFVIFVVVVLVVLFIFVLQFCGGFSDRNQVIVLLGNAGEDALVLLFKLREFRLVVARPINVEPRLISYPWLQ